MTKTILLEDREAFDEFCQTHIKTDADRIALLMMIRDSKHPQAKLHFDMLCACYREEFGSWPKFPAIN